MVVQKCRKMSIEEKRKLGVALAILSPDDLSKALDIVAQNNPGFQATADEVDLDIDAQVIILIIDQLGLIHTNARYFLMPLRLFSVKL
ncbi:PREDICTED: transcription factor GTE6-like [Prunus mume]|uniref:Transcription factor GTE6-like n=1 Tax=Prunus mume TaxID=102107 RepID=A0ABM1LM65_PRUMU|nr:PREDICTED: transcription factor GTE6-like [Prunus mume]XP_016648493.1 PREDICTED: transcription factor GTE6-like [Prunus mume]